MQWQEAGKDLEIIMNKDQNIGHFKYRKVKGFWQKKNIIQCKNIRSRE